MIARTDLSIVAGQRSSNQTIAASSGQDESIDQTILITGG